MFFIFVAQVRYCVSPADYSQSEDTVSAERPLWVLLRTGQHG